MEVHIDSLVQDSFSMNLLLCATNTKHTDEPETCQFDEVWQDIT